MREFIYFKIFDKSWQDMELTEGVIIKLWLTGWVILDGWDLCGISIICPRIYSTT
jgi:hypothetical protein